MLALKTASSVSALHGQSLFLLFLLLLLVFEGVVQACRPPSIPFPVEARWRPQSESQPRPARFPLGSLLERPPPPPSLFPLRASFFSSVCVQPVIALSRHVQLLITSPCIRIVHICTLSRQLERQSARAVRALQSRSLTCNTLHRTSRARELNRIMHMTAARAVHLSRAICIWPHTSRSAALIDWNGMGFELIIILN